MTPPTSLTRAIRSAMRARLRQAVRVVTAGYDIQVVSANTYRRVVGSFLEDGYVVGDEVTGIGFPVVTNNNPRLVVGVTATDLTVLPGTVGLTAAPLTAGLVLTVATPRAFAMERRTFTPPSALPYMAELLVPASSTPTTIGPKKRVENRGIYQITLHYPEDYGTLAQDAMADTIVETFYPGQVLSVGGFNVNITAAAAAQSIGSDAGYSRVPISVVYKVFTITPQ